MRISHNPFVPGRPVPADLFIGRLAQLDRLAQIARHSSMGRLNVSYLAGDKGIGKTSLVSFLRAFLQKDFGVLGVHVFLSGADTLEAALHRIFDGVVKAAAAQGWQPEGDDHFKIGRVGMGGVSLRATDLELLAIGENFDTIVRKIMGRLRPRFNGMMLVLDDINELSTSKPFAHWLKTFVDGASTSDVEPPLFLVLAGMEESRQALIASNDALDRILQREVLGPWSNDEMEEFFLSAFDRAGRPVTTQAIRAICRLCDGRPGIAHKIGDAALRNDADGHITEEDAMAALFSLEGQTVHAKPAPQMRPHEDVVPIPDVRPAPPPSTQSSRQLIRVLRSLI